MRHERIDTIELFKILAGALDGEFIYAAEGFAGAFKFLYAANGLKLTGIIMSGPDSLTLNLRGVEVKFTHASIDGLYPNRHDRNLNLSINGDDIVCVVPLPGSVSSRNKGAK